MFDRHDLAIKLAIEIIIVVLRHRAEDLTFLVDAVEGHHALRKALEAAPASDARYGVDRRQV